jgi:hypothetical protein
MTTITDEDLIARCKLELPGEGEEASTLSIPNTLLLLHPVRRQEITPQPTTQSDQPDLAQSDQPGETDTTLEQDS